MNKLYIIFFPLVLFIIIFFSTTPLQAKSFKIANLEISEEFGLNFNKENVVDKGFKKAFDELWKVMEKKDYDREFKNNLYNRQMGNRKYEWWKDDQSYLDIDK